MRFGILGPLVVRTPAGDATVAAARERTLLALLLLRANRVVPADELVEAIWDDNSPPTARSQLQICVSRLRRWLRRVGIDEEILLTQPTGYSLRVADGEADHLVFAAQLARGRQAVGNDDLDTARELFRSALALWRGSALTDVRGRGIEVAAAGWEEQRLAAFEEYAEVELRLGVERELIGELTDLVERNPLRERLRAQLMTALCRLGRPADALACYRAGRQVLADELGIEPGAELQQLHRRILSGDPDLARPALPDAANRAPRCLPRDVPEFTGREAAVAQLVKITPEVSEPGGSAPLVATIDGMAGTGKTALAVRVAHLVADRYPDAHLFVDLHGHSDRAPLEPAAALGALLRQLGVPAHRIPEPLDERITLWRTAVAGQRALIVLDNAAFTDQVQPLLPGGSRSLTLVTSRRRLVGLDGVHPISLDVLTPDEAVDLMTRVVGTRVAASRATAAEVAQLCGYLPLALRLAAARLAHRPRWSVADLANRLRAAKPLAALAADGRTVAAAFTLSYLNVDRLGQRVFRLLGLIPGADFDAYAVGALANLPVSEARDVIEDLVDAHLVESPAVDRYRLHDLIRDYAQELVAAAPDTESATTRLLDYYLHTTAQASAYLDKADGRSVLRSAAAPAVDVPVLDSDVSATTWLNTEWQNVIAVIRRAHAVGAYRHVCHLVRALWPLLWNRGHNSESVDVHGLAIEAARLLRDDASEASAHNYIASAYLRLAKLDAAIAHLTRSLDLRRHLGDVGGQALTLANLGVVYRVQGRYPESLQCGQTASDLSHHHGSRTSLMRSNDNLAITYVKLGRFDEALLLARRTLALARELDHPHFVSLCMSTIGVTHIRLGHYRLAVALLTRSVEMKRSTGNLYGCAESLADLGAAYRHMGRLDEALGSQRQAVQMARQFGEYSIEFLQVLNELGLTLMASGLGDEALATHRNALRLAERLGARYEIARAHAGMAAVRMGADPLAARIQARTHWRQALALFTEMGVPEGHEVAQRLAELDEHEN